MTIKIKGKIKHVELVNGIDEDIPLLGINKPPLYDNAPGIYMWFEGNILRLSIQHVRIQQSFKPLVNSPEFNKVFEATVKALQDAFHG